ncbi:unnamed protein product [Cercospora beticola]|nr:unnamed protein product [Cercospora beticola]
MSGNAGAEAPPHYFTMDDLEFLRANLGFMKVETLMQVIRDQYEGDTRATLDYANLDQLLPALNMAMWMAKGRPQQQRAATSAAPMGTSSHTTRDDPTAVLAGQPGSVSPNSPPPTHLQQAQQPPCMDPEISSSSTAAVMPAPTTAVDSLTSSIVSSDQTGDREATQIAHLQEDGIESASPAAQSTTTLSSSDTNASTANPTTTAPGKKVKANRLARSKSRPTLLQNPHHADMGIFAGKTIDEILTPNNEISTEEFFGARALFISAHFSGHKEALEKINQKRMAEGLPEMRFKDRTWNHRLEDALKHKFGPANYSASLTELGNAREDDQARAAYVAMLMSDLTNERNPTSVCTEESCIGKRARAQKKSLSTLNASTPAIANHDNPYATGSATESALDELSNEASASETSHFNAAGTARRSLKRVRNVNNTELVHEEPDGPSIKRRKSRKGRALSREGQAQGFDNRALDPALFSSNQTQSGAPYHQHFQQGNGEVTPNGYASVAEDYNYPPSSFTAPGFHAATTYSDDQVSESMRTGDVNGAVVPQEVDDEQGFGDVAQSFEEITAHVGGGIDTHHDGPAPTHFDQHND